MRTKLLALCATIVTLTLIINPSSLASDCTDCEVSGNLIRVSLQVNDKAQAARFFAPTDIASAQKHGATTFHYFYVEAKESDNYGITIRLQDISKRYSVPTCVDGRDVIDGRKINGDVGSAHTWGQAYILSNEGGNGGTIEGWREDENTVRRFVFTAPEKSLAGKWDDYSAMGTIVVSVFEENPPPELGLTTRGATRGLGTGYGERVESRVTESEFQAKPIASEVFVIRYRTRKELKKLGVWKPEKAEEKDDRFWPKKKKVGIDFPD